MHHKFIFQKKKKKKSPTILINLLRYLVQVGAPADISSALDEIFDQNNDRGRRKDAYSRCGRSDPELDDFMVLYLFCFLSFYKM